MRNYKVLGAGSRNSAILGIAVMIVINNIDNVLLFMKVFKKISKSNNNNVKMQNHKFNNRDYSTRVELTENYYKQKIEQMKLLDFEKRMSKTRYKKVLEEKMRHTITIEKGKEIDKNNESKDFKEFDMLSGKDKIYGGEI